MYAKVQVTKMLMTQSSLLLVVHSSDALAQRQGDQLLCSHTQLHPVLLALQWIHHTSPTHDPEIHLESRFDHTVKL